MILTAKYCSQCGHPAVGKYCTECGSKLVAPSDEGKAGASVSVEAPIDWVDECRYEILMQVPEVRGLIEEFSGRAVNGPTGEEILGLFEKGLGHGVPLAKLATIIQPIYTKWGISTGKQRAEVVSAPVGQVIVRVLCSLGRHGQTLKDAEQADDGCCFRAVLPSDLWSLAGSLVVTVKRHGAGAEVSAITKIGGSYFDWGKSRACLERLFNDVQTDPSRWKK